MNVHFDNWIPQFGDSPQKLLSLIADGRRTREDTSLASAARTTTTLGSIITNHDCRVVVFMVDVTAYTAGGLKIYLANREPISNSPRLVSASPAGWIAATGIYYGYFGIDASVAPASFVNQIASVGPTRRFQVYMEHQTGDSITYSVSHCLIP